MNVEIGRVSGTTTTGPDLAGGFIGITIDGFSDPAAGLQPGQHAQPLGIISRPLDPERDPQGAIDPTKVCATAFYWEAGRYHTQPLYDPRQVVLLPTPGKGATILYGGSESVVRYVYIDASGVTLGALASAIPIALATPLLSYLEAIDALVATLAGAVIPPATAALATYQAATDAVRSSIAATLAKAV